MTHNASLTRLQQWYRSHCDGDWEHAWRIRIGTIDNPGWSVRVNLEDTFDQPLEMDRFQVERTPDDWCSCWLEGQVFNGAAGSVNLEELLGRFMDWITRYEEVAVPREEGNGVEG